MNRISSLKLTLYEVLDLKLRNKISVFCRARRKGAEFLKDHAFDYLEL